MGFGLPLYRQFMRGGAVFTGLSTHSFASLVYTTESGLSRLTKKPPLRFSQTVRSVPAVRANKESAPPSFRRRRGRVFSEDLPDAILQGRPRLFEIGVTSAHRIRIRVHGQNDRVAEEQKRLLEEAPHDLPGSRFPAPAGENDVGRMDAAEG